MSDLEKANKIKPINSIEQLLHSYIIAEAIIDIRGDREKFLEKRIISSLEPLEVNDSELIEIYEQFYSIAGFNKNVANIMKIGLECLYDFNFKQDPSVPSIVSQADKIHLVAKYGEKEFSLISRINLFDHTLNALRYAMNIARNKQKNTQLGIKILCVLFHDFGKSTEIKNKLTSSRGMIGTIAHADLSGKFVSEKLTEIYFSVFKEHAPANIISQIEAAVKKHHTSNRNEMKDEFIKFVNEADFAARDFELKEIKKNLVTKESIK